MATIATTHYIYISFPVMKDNGEIDYEERIDELKLTDKEASLIRKDRKISTKRLMNENTNFNEWIYSSMTIGYSEYDEDNEAYIIKHDCLENNTKHLLTKTLSVWRVTKTEPAKNKKWGWFLDP